MPVDRGAKLGLLGVYCTAAGAMISSGIFVLPGLAFAYAGPAMIVSYLLAGLLATTGMLSQAELVSAMPKSGGTYFFVMRSMGPAVGAVDGLITWFSLSLKTAFAIVGMATLIALFVPLDVRLIGLCCTLFFVGVNLLGVKEAGRLQIGLVISLLALLVMYVGRGVGQVDVLHFTPFLPHGWSSVYVCTGLVFISYGGLLKVAAVAEDVQHPHHVIPTAMLLALLSVGVLYTAVAFVTCGVVDAGVLANSLTPIADGAAVFAGTLGRRVMGIAALLAFISTANAGLMASSRYPYALARDGLLPSLLARRHHRYHSPHVALILTGGLIGLALFMPLDTLVKAASSVLLLTFLFSCLCVIVMHESRLQNYQPRFRSPLYPWVQIVGVVGAAVLLGGMGRRPLTAVSILVAIGGFVYWFYGRIRSNREFALMHLIERITSRDLTDHLLETELREIIRERDDLTMDRFDRVVERCPIIDLPPDAGLDELFHAVADAVGREAAMSEDEVVELLHRREQEGSTVIGPGLAVPHLIVPGEGVFALVLVRARHGVEFPPDGERVHAVFVLAGSRDERNFHLRALSAICQIAQDPDFAQKWKAARDVESMRDVVLLGERRRSED